MMKVRRFSLLLAATCGVGFGLGVWLAPRIYADTTDDVCTGYHLGMSQDQIRQGLQRNDGRENEWQAWNDTNWPIIEGQCG